MLPSWASGLVLGTLLALSVGASAQPVVDGRLTTDATLYGAALSVQNTNTNFGNATNGDVRIANGGSEIDQLFARVTGGRLYVLIAGNLESNYNKMEVFIDSESGGMNQVNGSNAPAAVDPFCCPGSPSGTGALQQLNGLRFDTAFAADHYVTFSNGPEFFGSPTISTHSFSAYYGDLTAGAGGNKSEVGFQRFAHGFEPGLATGEPIDQLNNGCSGPTDTNCSPAEHEFAEPVDTVNDPGNSKNHRNLLNDIGFLMGIDNSNTQGVQSGSGGASGNPGSVTTGIEFSIPLSVLGNPTGDIRLAAFVNSSQHSFVSNQFAGDGVLQGNLGGNVGGINLASIAGNQFVTIPNGLPGDFDGNGSVDAADYTVWRDGLDTNNYTSADYAVWTSHYGMSSNAASIPEPSTLALTLLSVASFATRSRD